MCTHPSIQRKLIEYYERTGQEEWAELQRGCSPKFETVYVGSLRYWNTEVYFFVKDEGTMFASIYDVQNGRFLIDTVLEQDIIHRGYIWPDLTVNNMTSTEKMKLIDNINDGRIYVYKIEDNKVILSTSIFS